MQEAFFNTWEYSIIDVEPGDLPKLLDRTLLFPARAGQSEWAGFSLTMPHKTQVAPWLESAAERGLATVEVDPLVTLTGSANTIVAQNGGGDLPHLAAYNTDVYGIVAAIREIIRHGPVESVAILGTGATATSALVATRELGADSVVVYGRSASGFAEMRNLAARLGMHLPTYGVEPSSESYCSYRERDIQVLFECAAELSDFDAVISTLPAFAADPIAANLVDIGNEIPGRLGVLLDVVYHPNPTELLATWSALGGAVISGERMLLHQAAKQVELMTGHPAPLRAMDQALNAELEARYSKAKFNDDGSVISQVSAARINESRG